MKAKFQRCAKCGRTRYRGFIEWSPSLFQWRCVLLADCYKAEKRRQRPPFVGRSA